MKHKVLKKFRDKESRKVFAVDSFFESTDYDRVNFLEKEGFLKSHKDVSTLKEIEEKEDKPKRTTRKKESE